MKLYVDCPQSKQPKNMLPFQKRQPFFLQMKRICRHRPDPVVLVERQRRVLEGSFEAVKMSFVFNHNETCSWHDWHRHVSLVMLAFAMMAVIRRRANEEKSQKKPKPLMLRR